MDAYVQYILSILYIGYTSNYVKHFQSQETYTMNGYEFHNDGPLTYNLKKS